MPQVNSQKVRLQRVLADAGVAARRVCERLIEEGHVTVNGDRVTRLPVFVDPYEDEIAVDGRRLPRPERRLYLMLHKPTGTLVSAADEPGMDRKTVMDLIDHPSAPRLFPVGRLEYDTTGLVLLTNDGELANRLSHPRFRVTKTYQALVKGNLDEGSVQAIRTKLRAVTERELGRAPESPQIEILRREPGRTLLSLTLQEGPSRFLREVFQTLGMPIKKLTRTAVGDLQLKGLALGRWRELTRAEIQVLRHAQAQKRTGGGGSSRRARRLPARQEGRAGRKPPRSRGARPAKGRSGPSKGGRRR
jgi:23S rRNA pseudouridine2605 synthase